MYITPKLLLYPGLFPFGGHKLIVCICESLLWYGENGTLLHYWWECWYFWKHCSVLSHVRLFQIFWLARQAPLSMGFFQTRILEWVAILSSRESSRLGLNTCLLSILHCRQVLYLLVQPLYVCSVTQSVRLFGTPWPARLLCPWYFPGKNAGMDCCFFPQ